MFLDLPQVANQNHLVDASRHLLSPNNFSAILPPESLIRRLIYRTLTRHPGRIHLNSRDFVSSYKALT